MNTLKHEEIAVKNKSPFIHATIIPTTSATAPEIGDCVALMIAGNVITAKVT